MTTLRVILDEVLAPTPTGTARYAEELTRALIATAPPGCAVGGIVASSPESDYALLRERLPGITDLFKSALARRELTAAWQHGFTPVPSGMVHAPSLLAPLQRHDRVNETGHQMVVTMHDAVAWTHPDSLSPRHVAWHKAMAKRAQRYADAIVVPTHAVAAELDELLGIGDRTRVIGGAVSPRLRVPADEDALADALGLPDRYLVTVSGLESRRGVAELLAALALPSAPGLPLLAVGPDEADGISLAGLAADAGLSPDRVRSLGRISDAELAVVLDRATALVFPSLAEGFGLPVLEAFALGTPVIHSDAAALVEVAGDAGLPVPLAPLEGYPARLAEAIGRVVYDPGFAAELAVLGRDRAGLFSWRASAEKVWALHADL